MGKHRSYRRLSGEPKHVIPDAELSRALDLEAARRGPPLDAKGFSTGYELSDAAYQAWLRRYGFLMITELQQHRQEALRVTSQSDPL